MPYPASSPVRPVFAQVLDDLLSRGTIHAQLDDLGLSIMAYTLYRYVETTAQLIVDCA